MLGIGFAGTGLLLAQRAGIRLARGAGDVGTFLPLGAVVVAAMPPFWDLRDIGPGDRPHLRLVGRVAVVVRISRDRRPYAPAACRPGGRRLGGVGVPDPFRPGLVQPGVRRSPRGRGLACWTMARRRPARRHGGTAPRIPDLPHGVLRAPRAEHRPREGGEPVPVGARLAVSRRPRPAVLAVGAGRGARRTPRHPDDRRRPRRDDCGRRARRLRRSPPFVHTLYIVRVGGDFMHARLLLPALFALVAPVSLPLSVADLRPARSPLRVAAAGLVAAWAVSALALPRDGSVPRIADGTIADERFVWGAEVRLDLVWHRWGDRVRARSGCSTSTGWPRSPFRCGRGQDRRRGPPL